MRIAAQRTKKRMRRMCLTKTMKIRRKTSLILPTLKSRMMEGKPVIIQGDGTSLWTLTWNQIYATIADALDEAETGEELRSASEKENADSRAENKEKDESGIFLSECTEKTGSGKLLSA